VPSAARCAVAPLYLLACLILGGSAQGVWQNMLLQLAGLAIISWAAAAPSEEPLPGPAKSLLALALAAVALVALQEVPVPRSVWAHGIGARVAGGYRLLGRPMPPLPLSLTPYESLSSLLALIPGIAIFCAIVRLRAYRASWLAPTLLAGAVAGIVLGALQVASKGPNSPWYLYPETNLGAAVGFFANANHMADLLVITLPFLAAIAAAGRSRSVQRYSTLLAILAASALLVIVGIVLNRSLAGYVLAIPVIAASALIVAPPSRTLRWSLGLVAALSVAASIAVLATSSIGSTRIGQDASSSVQSREQILATTGKAIRATMPLGSGLGSFVKVYRLYESPDTVTNEYVVHAHNDYAELVLELGIPGVILVLAFLLWWAAAARAAWRTAGGGAFARAATIASAAILVHSLVDFPLRTAAISACFAMCLALLADRRPVQRPEPDELRPTRHVVVT
jgi:O-antigen ligase